MGPTNTKCRTAARALIPSRKRFKIFKQVFIVERLSLNKKYGVFKVSLFYHRRKEKHRKIVKNSGVIKFMKE